MTDVKNVLVVTIVVMSAGSALYTLRTYMEPHMKVAVNLAEANMYTSFTNGSETPDNEVDSIVIGGNGGGGNGPGGSAEQDGERETLIGDDVPPEDEPPDGGKLFLVHAPRNKATLIHHQTVAINSPVSKEAVEGRDPTTGARVEYEDDDDAREYEYEEGLNKQQGQQRPPVSVATSTTAPSARTNEVVEALVVSTMATNEQLDRTTTAVPLPANTNVAESVPISTTPPPLAPLPVTTHAPAPPVTTINPISETTTFPDDVELIRIDPREKRNQVLTRSGIVEGLEMEAVGKRVHAFLGVPYAEAPVGALRFKRSRPAVPWTGVRKAKVFGSPCLQYFPNNTELPMNMLRKDISEDCLHLNIWTASLEGPPQPVILFLHGGGFTFGGNAVDEQDGRVLAAFANLVVVTINYRLGPLGFADGNANEVPGNMGLHDMLLALKWVKANIEAFGGDPEAVTIVGHQAGAMAASMFLLSPMAKSLFKRAILQSGAATVFNVYYQRSAPATELLAASLGCSGGTINLTTAPGTVMECMRSMPIDRLKRATDDQLSEVLYSYAPKIGDEINPMMFQLALESAAHLGPQKEILIGSNADEGSLFFHLGNPDIFAKDHAPQIRSTEEAKELVADSLKDWGFENATLNLINRFYLEKTRSADPRILLKATYNSFGDIAFTCPTVYFAEKFSSQNRSAYYYYMTHRSEGSKVRGDWFGSTHGDEIQYIFGVPLRYPHRYTGTDIDFSKSMMKIWATFARTGRPPRVNGREWPKYTEERPIYVELNGKIMKEGKMRTGTGPHKENCDTWKYAYKLLND